MGKRQHQKDKLYLTCTEWSNVYGGRRPDQRSRDEIAQKIARLPFDHCSLSLQPITTPVCNEEGYTFEKEHLIKFVEKFGCDPITGTKPFGHKNIISLNLHKNQEGHYHCPVLFKPFNENSKITCVKKTGNVYLHEAIEELNLKTKNFRDLLNDEPFVKKDLIIIQDPMDATKVNPSQYYHFQKNLRWADDEGEGTSDDSGAQIKKMDHVTKSTLAELASTYEPSGSLSSGVVGQSSAKVDKFNAAPFSTGRAAASLTSTVMSTFTETEAAALSDETVRYSRVKKKGYVQLETSFGNLNLELYCQWVQKACENFIGLARKGYYNGTIFHRLIKNFMVQGGDPTGTGTGGESIWGTPFADDFHQHLSHDSRGVLSMANSGPNSNKSQFFITFRPCKHLDKKHTIFGRVVGGLDVLSAIEKVSVDDKEKPIEQVILKSVSILVDPFKEVDDFLENERKQMNEEPKTEKKKIVPQQRTGVGSFVDLSQITSLTSDEDPSRSSSTVPDETSKNKKKKSSSSFGNFSNW